MNGATIIEVELLSGRYHAHVWGESQFGMGGPEWPPSPWRLLRALASAWFCASPCPSSDADRNRLLQSLGRAESPELWVPRTSLHELRYYQPIVEDGVPIRKPHHDHFAVLEGGRFWFCFAVTLDDAQRALLDSLLARIRYFGRAESRALLRQLPDHVEPPHGTYRVIARHGTPAGSATVFKRVLGTDSSFVPEHLWSADDKAGDPEAAYPPHLVDTLLNNKRPLPRGARWIEYELPVLAIIHEVRPRIRTPEPAKSVNVVEIHFRLSRRIPIPLRQLVAVSRAFRDATVDAHLRISDGSHSQSLTGREADNSIARGNDHAYYLPRLGSIGSKLDALVVLVPEGKLTRSEFDALLSVQHIRAGGRTYPITAVCEQVVQRMPESQSGSAARRWKSTTPFVPPLHHRRDRGATTLEEQAAACVARVCGQRPDTVLRVPGPSGTASVTSLLVHEYAHSKDDKNERRWKLTHRLGFWLEIVFSDPVYLNVPVGADAHFGSGQFAPADSVVS